MLIKGEDVNLTEIALTESPYCKEATELLIAETLKSDNIVIACYLKTSVKLPGLLRTVGADDNFDALNDAYWDLQAKLYGTPEEYYEGQVCVINEEIWNIPEWQDMFVFYNGKLFKGDH